MSDQNDADDLRGQLRQEAATWFARMRGPDAETHRPAFEAWLARGALHRSAYNRIAEIFSAGKLLKDDNATIDRRLAIALLSAVLLGMAALMLALAVLGHAGDRVSTSVGARASAVQVASVIGQLRKVAFADGSIVTLDSDTLVSARFGSSSRVLRLERGRARFEVRHDDRPFIVLAGDRQVLARGTIFDVGLHDGGRVDVALLRGVVEITTLEDLAGRPRGPPVILRPGERLVGGDRSRPLAPIPIKSEPDWTRQRLLFDRAPLSEVVEAANQRNVDRIVISDPATARLRVSGTFRIIGATQLSERLASLFDLVVDRRTPGIIVLQPRPRK